MRRNSSSNSAKTPARSARNKAAPARHDASAAPAAPPPAGLTGAALGVQVNRVKLLRVQLAAASKAAEKAVAAKTAKALELKAAEALLPRVLAKPPAKKRSKTGRGSTVEVAVKAKLQQYTWADVVALGKRILDEGDSLKLADLKKDPEKYVRARPRAAPPHPPSPTQLRRSLWKHEEVVPGRQEAPRHDGPEVRRRRAPALVRVLLLALSLTPPRRKVELEQRNRRSLDAMGGSATMVYVEKTLAVQIAECSDGGGHMSKKDVVGAMRGAAIELGKNNPATGQRYDDNTDISSMYSGFVKRMEKNGLTLEKTRVQKISQVRRRAALAAARSPLLPALRLARRSAPLAHTTAGPGPGPRLAGHRGLGQAPRAGAARLPAQAQGAAHARRRGERGRVRDVDVRRGQRAVPHVQVRRQQEEPRQPERAGRAHHALSELRGQPPERHLLHPVGRDGPAAVRRAPRADARRRHHGEAASRAAGLRVDDGQPQARALQAAHRRPGVPARQPPHGTFDGGNIIMVSWAVVRASQRRRAATSHPLPPLPGLHARRPRVESHAGDERLGSREQDPARHHPRPPHEPVPAARPVRRPHPPRQEAHRRAPRPAVPSAPPAA